MKLKLLSAKAELVVTAHETILHQALSQGIPYPHSCKTGHCSACKSRLISGEVERVPASRFALTTEEIDADTFLPAKLTRDLMWRLIGWKMSLFL